jgi:hypothetical protein
MQTLAALKQSRKALRNRLNRFAQQDRPDLAVCGELCHQIESLDKEIEQVQAAVTVGVYRKHQSGWTSPCQLADPCEVCKAHQAGKKRNTLCPKARPNEPAFRVPVKTAITLVTDGLAEFINRGKGIRLTFSRLAHLRDRSLKIDEAFLIAYAAGEKWAHNLFAAAWDGKAQAETVVWSPAQMAESREEIRSFE